MINKTQIIIFIIAVVLLGGFMFLGKKTSTPKQDLAVQQSAWPSRKVSEEKVSEEIEYLSIDTAYPVTASESITTYFKSFVDEQIAQFKQDTAWVTEAQEEYAPPAKLSISITYEEAQSSTVQTYIFRTYLYTGGAHGMQLRRTFSFTKEGQLITISNIFTNGFDGLPTFASLVQKEILRKEGTTSDWVKDGAGAREENYRSFIVSDKGITILFDPYQVAPYAFGPLDIFIPREAFARIAHPDIFPPVATP